MNKITYVNIRKKSKKLYKKTHTGKKDLWEHVETVEKIAKFFCEETDLSEKDKYAIYLGCILHDIGKTKKAKKWNRKNKKLKGHNKIGKKYLEKRFLKKYKIDEYDKDIILNMVRYHTGKYRINKVYAKNNKNPISAFAISLVRFADDAANGKIKVIEGKIYKKL